MKHPILLIAFLLLPLLSFSQGVTFEQGSWKDALALAKQTNKPVMLFVYSSDDAGRMFNESAYKYIFSNEPVGDVCKTYFVCYKMDVSKNEYVELAKTFGQTNPPAVLFVNADGGLLSRLGLLLVYDAGYFLEQVKMVLLDLKDTKPMAAWDAEFPQKKNDPAFLLEYINKRDKLRLNYNEAFEAYLRLLPANEPMPEQVAKLFHMNAGQIRVTDDAYQYFTKHLKEFSTAIANVYSNPRKEYDLLRSMVQCTINEATLSKDEALLKKAMAAFRQIPYDSDKDQEEELYMDYYKKTNQPEKYFVHARIFATESLKKLDSDMLLLKDNTRLKELERMALENDTAQFKFITRMKENLPTTVRGQLCGKLNSIAWYIFETSSDKASLKEALTWSEKTVHFNPTSSIYLDTNANLLYKLGRKEEAIALQKKAVASFTGSPSYTVFSDTLKKMEAGEKTW